MDTCAVRLVGSGGRGSIASSVPYLAPPVTASLKCSRFYMSSLAERESPAAGTHKSLIALFHPPE